MGVEFPAKGNILCYRGSDLDRPEQVPVTALQLRLVRNCEDRPNSRQGRGTGIALRWGV
jgi:hypothetical protein